MLLLIAAVIFGVWLYNRAPRLEGASETGSAVHAYIDGKRVDSYVKEG